VTFFETQCSKSQCCFEFYPACRLKPTTTELPQLQVMMMMVMNRPVYDRLQNTNRELSSVHLWRTSTTSAEHLEQQSVNSDQQAAHHCITTLELKINIHQSDTTCQVASCRRR